MSAIVAFIVSLILNVAAVLIVIGLMMKPVTPAGKFSKNSKRRGISNMKPKDLLEHLEKGDRTEEWLTGESGAKESSPMGVHDLGQRNVTGGRVYQSPQMRYDTPPPSSEGAARQRGMVESFGAGLSADAIRFAVESLDKSERR